MRYEWFKSRGYKHFDAPVGEKFADAVCSPQFVTDHSWLPLIRYIKSVKRYKPTEGRTEFKDRPIMYASHRDACILAKYSHDLSLSLDNYYLANGLSEHVIAYRKLGRANYHFSSHAYRCALANAPCVVLCFDITGFFDNLNHSILKERLKRILHVKELSEDWYRVFRHVTVFKTIERTDIAKHPVFGPRLKLNTKAPITTIAQAKAAGIAISVNPNVYGIPQGTPISSALSNLYMIDIDTLISKVCRDRGALYQRYSDDILLVCRLEDESYLVDTLRDAIKAHKLEIKDAKTERLEFGVGGTGSFQYLGFNMSRGGAIIRPSSLARQWRKFRRGIRQTKRKGTAEILSGRSTQIFTKKLRKKLSPIGIRNFSQYARRSATAFGEKGRLRQIRRLEKEADRAIRDLKITA